MLTIGNDGEKIAETNYWGSEYDRRDLVYLSANAGIWRLLLPSNQAAAWLAEIMTARCCIIEPSLRAAYPDYVDLVFDDGSKTPFVLSLDPSQQCDRLLQGGETTLLIYAGGLDKTHRMPCTIRLPQASTQPRDKFVEHVTINTGHTRRSPRSEVPDDTVQIIDEWLTDLLAGKTRFVYEDQYAVQLEWSNSKAAGFVISRASADMQYTPLVRFAVCTHSRHKDKTWRGLGGEGDAPSVPFVAASLLESNLTPEDMVILPMLGDFERCMAWAFIERNPGQ